MDCCSKSSVEDCECTSLGEFVLECSRAGVDMSNGWRQPGLCPLICNNGTEYNECGPPCPPTCADQEPVCNIQKCVDGCHCPEGTLLQDGQCIPLDECPCFYGDQYYQSGETVQEDCNTCVCQAGNWKCTDSICPSTCAVFGPHFTTFDGFAYDFQGKCSYYLVDSDSFNVKVDYNTNCRENYINAVSGVCIKSITIHTPEEAVVKLKPSIEITVNGREMTSLPVIAPGIYVGQSTSKYLRTTSGCFYSRSNHWEVGGRSHLTSVATEFGIAHSIVSRLWRQFQTTGTAIRGFSSGRPQGTTPADDRYIVLQARRNRRQTAGEIARHTTQATGRPISRFAVARRLHGGCLFARRPVRCVPLTPAHQRRRSLWCREHQNWRDKEWGRVLFTDESRFSLSSDSHRILIWRERGSRNHPSNIIERDRYGGRGVLVWGGIMLGSRTDLHIFDAGSVNGTRYCNEILLPYVRLFRGAMGLQFLFMDDNAPCHRTVAAKQLLESENIERMDWPARSPDLNPIEHVWDFLGRRLAARTLPPVTIRELRLRCKTNGQQCLNNSLTPSFSAWADAAQLNNGLEILWDLDQNIQVFSPKELFGSLRGLCGTFTKSRQDEFLTPEGDIETTTGGFVQKWQVEESCIDVEEPTDLEGSEKACDTYSERRGVASEHRTATAGSEVVQSGRPIFDDFFHHLWPYIGNNTANVVFQMVKRLWLIRIDQ
ncbi:hypothetical protein TNCV_4035091 [Trichonephila clavipes]|nr:hypothetical protein TNCV_4035091 [Trichonephila clavipes]